MECHSKPGGADQPVHRLSIDSAKLLALMNTSITGANLNEYGRFDDLKSHSESSQGQSLL